MSKTMKLHPVTIMLTLLIFGHFFGILGMVFATPIVSCIKVIANFINQKYEIINIINKK
jgi:predicted PurR-regulated permease PerM